MLKIIKWLILAAAYAFLAYKLATYDGYGILWMQWQQSSWHDWIPLLLMLALLPINWAIEAKKWQMLCRPFEPQPFTQALQAVLGALVPAFITPNRIGEIVGRPMFLKKENRIAGAAAAVLNGCAQTIAIVGCGVPSLFFAQATLSRNSIRLTTYMLICLGVCCALFYTYSYLPKAFRWLSKKKCAGNLADSFGIIAKTDKRTQYEALLMSILRYGVFCLQFYFMLRFFKIYIPAADALSVIPLYYLLVTVTPSIAASEAGIRSSYAIVCFSAFSPNTAAIAGAGFMLWLINFIVPMIAGSVWNLTMNNKLTLT